MKNIANLATLNSMKRIFSVEVIHKQVIRHVFHQITQTEQCVILSTYSVCFVSGI